MRLPAVVRVLFLLLPFGAATNAYAQTPDTTRITATRLAEGVYVLMGQGGNIGLSTGPNGDGIRAYHVAPAHTDGDVIIHLTRANIFHMGDTYFNGFYPFIDVGTGGTADGMIAAADRVLAEANAGTKIIPGHGPVSGRSELAAYREMLAGVRDKVKPMVKAGRSLAQVQAARPSARWDATWGSSFFTPEQFVAVVFQSLRGK